MIKSDRIVIDALSEKQSHKPKVFARFSEDGYNDFGSLDSDGFKLYRYAEGWKAYTIFTLPGVNLDYEDSAVADINNDGWNDIVLGGWGNRTIWAANPSGSGQNPYTTKWDVHIVDDTRFSHEVCAADLNKDGKCDIITTSGIYLQGETPYEWSFVDIGRGGQGTSAGNVLNNGDGYNDVVALLQEGGKNKIAWFENPGHTGGDPAKGPWTARVVDENPGGDLCNHDMTCMAFTLGDINGDGRLEVVAASQGEGPDPDDDNRQIGDGLVWYESPGDPRTGPWFKHVIDPSVAWVHASSIQLADFNGDGHMDVCYAEQDQCRFRHDGNPSQRLGIYFNMDGSCRIWEHQIYSRYPDDAAGGFNSRVGIVGGDALPSILTARHGHFGDTNPLILWRNKGK